MEAAALDVMTAEPPGKNQTLLQARSIIITPHIAWATKEARIRPLEIAAGNLEARQSGAPVYAVYC